MNRKSTIRILLVVLITLSCVSLPFSQGKEKIKIAKEKQLVLDWLSQPQTVEKFGKIFKSLLF